MYQLSEEQRQMLLKVLGEVPAKLSFEAVATLINLKPIEVEKDE